MCDENEKFEKLVLFIAENYNSYDTELNDAITTFEEAIEASGNGEAAFGIARDDWERIEITEPPYKYSDAQILRRIQSSIPDLHLEQIFRQIRNSFERYIGEIVSNLQEGFDNREIGE